MQNENRSRSLLARVARHLGRNVVAYVALVVAVSLTPLPSYAANALVGTSGIKNGAVTTPKLAKSAVKAAKLAPNAVSSTKILNGSVAKSDLAASARGFTGIVAREVTKANVADGTTDTATVTCHDGEVAIGGGGYVTPGGSIILIGTTAGILQLSHPTSPISLGTFHTSGGTSDGKAPTGWRTTVLNNQGDAETAVHYAICATK